MPQMRYFYPNDTVQFLPDWLWSVLLSGYTQRQFLKPKHSFFTCETCSWTVTNDVQNCTEIATLRCKIKKKIFLERHDSYPTPQHWHLWNLMCFPHYTLYCSFEFCCVFGLLIFLSWQVKILNFAYKNSSPSVDESSISSPRSPTGALALDSTVPQTQ